MRVCLHNVYAVPPMPPHLNAMSVSLAELMRPPLCPSPSAIPHTAIDASLIAVASLCGEGGPEQHTSTATSTVSALEMENAKLRMDLASHIAAVCARELMASQQAQAQGMAQQQQSPSQQPSVLGGGSFRHPSVSHTRTDSGGAAAAPSPTQSPAAAAASPRVSGSGASEGMEIATASVPGQQVCVRVFGSVDST